MRDSPWTNAVAKPDSGAIRDRDSSPWPIAAFRRYGEELRRRSATVAPFFERRMSAIAVAWVIVFLAGSLPRMLFPASPVHGFADLVQIVLPYLVVAAAPIVAWTVADRSFPRGLLSAQPGIRLAVYGRWRPLSVLEAQASPLFGPAGFVASLLIGLLLNVVVRSFEFLVAMPALNGHAPAWGQALFHLMAADVVVMSFFYTVCFVLALRSNPWFPRMLVFAWGLDVCAQLVIAGEMAAMPGLPAEVAMPLRDLLTGNLHKALISVLVWLPYLVLSARVNVTYRRRAPLAG